jgi:hypothetical protein
MLAELIDIAIELILFVLYLMGFGDDDDDQPTAYAPAC